MTTCYRLDISFSKHGDGMICSMSRKGNCWDNAPTESWFNSFKNERVHGLRYETRAKITAMTFEYIEVLYNQNASTRRSATSHRSGF
jgi:transposase InsO family protein